jgi:hypothetical protein
MRMGKFLRVLAAGFIGGALGVVGVVSSAQAGPWEFAGAYATEAECQEAGHIGVAAGEWPEYQCTLFEGLHDLYVRIA